ncbi:hypothetical protein RvY_11261-2 [Ramazzottius varieornatus]|uniref:Receptor ligand binding region domain-containing protein n=1 Tax=Ramazzottius varieornatus TaxID=947166 RepID=A0A1D1VHL5_RAMVA|nr:hypothetical protein RvY_11261-2 [Ramazzottius varieornatus]
MVCDVNRNPAMLLWCTGNQNGLSTALQYNVSLLQVDGFFTTTNYTFVMEEIRRQTRVIIYMVFGGTLRKLMMAAQSANMTQGDFVHISSIILRHPIFGNYNWRYGENEDVTMKAAYRTVLFLEKDTVDDYPPYGSDLYFLKERWRNASSVRYNISYTPDTVNFHLTAAYAMFLSTAQVVQEFLDSNRPHLLEDGRNIARAFYSRTFTLRTGNFSLDEYGTLAGSNTILQQYYPDDALQLILKIQVMPLEIREVHPLHWPGPIWPPPNRPKCGFDGQDPVCWETGKPISLHLNLK